MIDNLTISANDRILAWADTINRQYLPMGTFYLPEDMESAWEDVTREWPSILRRGAHGTCENGLVLISPAKYRVLGRQRFVNKLNKRFIIATSAVVHELLHYARRKNGNSTRDDEFSSMLNGGDEQIGCMAHLYLEEAVAEILTMWIMMREQMVWAWDNLPIAYEDATYTVAGFLMSSWPNHLTYLIDLFTETNQEVLVNKTREILYFAQNKGCLQDSHRQLEAIIAS